MFQLVVNTKSLIDLILTSSGRPTIEKIEDDYEVIFLKEQKNTKICIVKKSENNFYYIDGHLGGCSREGDPATWTPQLWEHIVKHFSIKSVVDVGCGFGHSTKYFNNITEKTIGIEGSSNVIRELDEDLIKIVKQHDYSQGPLKIDSCDLVWSCEFVEHVDEIFLHNFMETFKSGKYVAMTYAYPGQGGHHHVNEQPESYWIDVMKKNGFEYLENTTKELRKISLIDAEKYNSQYGDNHFSNRGLFFKNLNSR